MELISIFSGLIFILISKEVIDRAGGSDFQELFPLLAFLIIALFSGYACSIYSARLNEITRARMLNDLQTHISSSQAHAKTEFLLKYETGDLLMRTSSDASEAVLMMGQSWITAILAFVRIIAAIIIVGTFDFHLSLILVLLCPLVLLSKTFFQKIKKLNRSLKEREGEMTSILQENYKYRLYFRLLNWHEERNQMLEFSKNVIFKNKVELINFTTKSKTLLGLVLQIGYLTTFIWGVWKLQSKEMSFGTLSALMLLLGRIQGPLVSLMGIIPTMVRSWTSLERIILSLQIKQEEKIKPVSLDNIQNLELCKIRFAYAENLVLNDFNSVFEKGKPTAIVGPSGMGKTTILHLLMGLHKPLSGKVFIQTDRSTLIMSNNYRQNFAFVAQGDHLLAGTVLYNLVGNKRSVPPEKISEALRLACAEFVFELPMGLDTHIGEGGFGLSEGQGQRISIARAILQDRKIWLLDEITSALDQENRTRLVTNLLNSGKDKILIFVTHDKELESRCTKRIYL